jgi:hypothetical protein
VLKNKMPGGISGLRKVEMAGGRRKRHNTDCRAYRMNVCRILVKSLEGKRSLGRRRRRWNNNFETDVEGRG